MWEFILGLLYGVVGVVAAVAVVIGGYLLSFENKKGQNVRAPSTEKDHPDLKDRGTSYPERSLKEEPILGSEPSLQESKVDTSEEELQKTPPAAEDPVSSPISNKEQIDELFENYMAQRGTVTTVTPPVIQTGRYALLNGRPGGRTRDFVLKWDSMLRNKPYLEAVDIAKSGGHELHILYNGLSQKMPRTSSSPTVIGVRIKDPKFDEVSRIPSNLAIVNEVIDQGGIDEHNAGMPNL